jgi:hypothetical protein
VDVTPCRPGEWGMGFNLVMKAPAKFSIRDPLLVTL